MEKSSKRGKIPQSDWPLIMARYEAGETLSNIARTYDCSPPAISYVVNRSRARRPTGPPPNATVPTTAAEPQLIKAHATAPQATANGGIIPPAASARPAWEQQETGNGLEVPPGVNGETDDGRHIEHWRPGIPTPARDDGAALEPSRHAIPPAPAVPTPSPSHAGNGNLDHRPKLHLALGNGSHGESGSHPGSELPPVEAQRIEQPRPPMHQPYPAHRLDRTSFGAEPMPPHNGPSASARPVQAAGGFEPSGNGHSLQSVRHDGNGAAKEGTGTFIDRELRARVGTDVAAFLAAFDAALTQDSPENRSALREATDRLLRAGARTRIELERLDARMPLPRRDPAGRREPSWQDR